MNSLTFGQEVFIQAVGGAVGGIIAILGAIAVFRLEKQSSRRERRRSIALGILASIEILEEASSDVLATLSLEPRLGWTEDLIAIEEDSEWVKFRESLDEFRKAIVQGGPVDLDSKTREALLAMTASAASWIVISHSRNSTNRTARKERFQAIHDSIVEALSTFRRAATPR